MLSSFCRQPKSSIRRITLAIAGCLAINSWAQDPEATQTQIESTSLSIEQSNSGKLALKELQAFVNAFSQIRKTYVEEIDDKTLLENAIQGMLSGLDPHSNYLPPQNFDDLQVSATGEFGGLGIEVGMENGFVKVISPIDDTPASRAGVESGDLIIKIDNKPVKGMSLNEAVKLMRGEVGTKIELTIVRKDVPQPIELTLERDVIAVVSVRQEIIDDHYLKVRIAQFQANTGKDLEKVIQKAKQENDIKGIVLDLRNNPGGVLQAAVQVVDLFIDDGLIVYTEGRIKESLSEFSGSTDTPAITTPLVVLINGGSASASEIVAGALQDYNRAVILGTTSFGKGSVQSVIPLAENYGMKLTTARYFTPKGRSIQAQGIVPDIVVERSKITRHDPSPIKAVTEADLRGHLSNTNGESEADSDTEQAQKTLDNLVSNDAQLHEAVTLLKGLALLGGSAQTNK